MYENSEFFTDCDGIKVHARLVPIEGDDHCYNYHLEEVLKAVKEFLTEEANL